jgi:anhydro-N-acetylmuramic acid kinase
MSGTSLDGVDLACCNFQKEKNWRYSFLHTDTIPYPRGLKEKLKNAMHCEAEELVELDHELGRYLGDLCGRFIRENRLEPDFIASHGHTVFHRPDRGFSLQIGNGYDINAATGIPVIYDFRSADIALGGQGAPLVPAGDMHLFPEYDACLNLGGFSNITVLKAITMQAWDICPVNTLLNDLSVKLGREFDYDGELGRSGVPDRELVNRLNELSYYHSPPPKSLGREFLDRHVYPLIKESKHDHKDVLSSCYQHIATQIARTLEEHKIGNVLISGGGARNRYLIDLLREGTSSELSLANPVLNDFKEAMVFGFLGLLRLLGEKNCFASVTGASADTVAGSVVNMAAKFNDH